MDDVFYDYAHIFQLNILLGKTEGALQRWSKTKKARIQSIFLQFDLDLWLTIDNDWAQIHSTDSNSAHQRLQEIG